MDFWLVWLVLNVIAFPLVVKFILKSKSTTWEMNNINFEQARLKEVMK